MTSQQDPEDYVYVSTRNYNRKKNILSKQESSLTSIIGEPGPIAGITIHIFDAIVNFVARITLSLLKISEYAFDFINNYAFGNFNGFLPNSVIGGKVFTYKFFRYVMTILLPPMGVLMGKGLYGFFNIFVCLILTYINYIAGIIYAFVITNRNRYADQYEDYEYNLLKSQNPDTTILPNGSDAFVGMCGFIVIFVLSICLFLYVF